MKEYIAHIRKILGKKTGIKDLQLEVPRELSHGDLALPCYQLSKEKKAPPGKIAEELAKEIQPDEYIESANALGPYLNFFLKKDRLLKELFSASKKKSLLEPQSQGTVMVEYSSPNLNKPMHIGHIRNNLLGYSISLILESLGSKVIRANLYNDRGMGVSEAIYSYLYLSEKKEPEGKPDHFVGDLYVLFRKKQKENPELEEKAREILKRYEQGDKEVLEAWKKLTQWVMQGYEETYKRLGSKFDKVYWESGIFQEGKKIVEEGLKKGILAKKDGAVIAPLESHGLPDKVLIKSDGTSLYITQDLALAKKKFEDYPLDKSIYVVGSEQELHFAQLFKICELLGIAKAEKMHHLSYGLVLLPEGRMKSREGKVVDADEFLDKITQLASEELSSRGIDNKALAEKIALSAVKFYMLMFEPRKDFVYSPEQSLSFEGESGVYVQYTHARIQSVLEKSGISPGTLRPAFSQLNTEEKRLASLCAAFQKTVEAAAERHKPSLIATYLIRLCQEYNSYYHTHPILTAEKAQKENRLALSYIVKEAIKEGLRMLDIEALNRI